jgi:HJR/Mrr/RecB family endonuclease
VEVVPAKGNFGADLILYKWGRKIVVRIKKSEKSVGLSAVQEVAGAIGYHKADKAIVITNGKYTKAAKRLAITNKVQALDKDDLIKKKIVQ